MAIVIDFETRSRRNLKKVGGHVYTEDESTEVLCAVALDLRVQPAVCYVWSQFGVQLTRWQPPAKTLEEIGIGPGEIVYAPPILGSDEVPKKIFQAAEEGVSFIAHNAKFDRGVWEGCGLPRTEWIDTVALCRRRGLPGDLQRVGEALFAGRSKDSTGARVMRQSWAPMTRGRRKGEFLEPDGPRLSAIILYCCLDVYLTAMAYLSEDMDAPHADDAVLRAHDAIDARGVAVDLPLARLLLQVDQASALREAAEAERLTGGEVDLTTLRSPLALVAWLKAQGISVSDVQAPTVRGLL